MNIPVHCSPIAGFRQGLLLLTLPAMLLVKPATADSLGDLRLFYSAEERRSIDSGQRTGVALPAGGTADETLPPTIRADPSGSTSGNGGGRGGNANPREQASAPGSQSPTSPSRVEFTGIVRSSQGDLFLINGLPWQPGALGIRTISRQPHTGEIELQFEAGARVTLSIGQGVPYGADANGT